MMLASLLRLLVPGLLVVSAKVVRHGNVSRCIDYVRSHDIPRPRNATWSMAVMVRVHNMHSLLADFVGHYFHEGAEHIVLFDDRSDPPIIVDDERVTVIKMTYPGLEDCENQHSDRCLKGFVEHMWDCRDSVPIYMRELGYTWQMFVDIDEFMTTKAQPERTVAEELQTTFRDAVEVLVPWLFMNDDRDEEPESSLVEITWRKLARPEAKVYSKCIARLDECTKTTNSDHFISVTASKTCVKLRGIRSGLNNKMLDKRAEHAIVFHFSEDDVDRARLLTYHYQIRSKESVKQRCAPHSIWQHHEGQDHVSCVDKFLQHVKREKLDTTLHDKTVQRNAVTRPFRLIEGVVTQKYATEG